MRSTALRVSLALLAAAAGCGRAKTTSGAAPAAALDELLFPATFAASLQRAGGGHFRATTMLRADVPAGAPADAGKPAAPPAVITMTELWMDGSGNFRLHETNDQDGGREIVRVGGEIAVALRYGKMVRRPVQDAESNRVLAEALGGPWTAWGIVRRQVEVVTDGRALRFKLGDRLTALPPAFPAAEGLRKWRDSVSVTSLEGSATLDGAAKLPLAVACTASFRATREQVPIVGEVAVTATLEEVGKVPKVEMPEAMSPRTRQRTVLEERALLGGISAVGRPEGTR